MRIVMNVVQVREEHKEDFERAFLDRESLVHRAPGFAGFELLRKGDGEYIVLTRWETDQAFRDWVGSDLFKRSHRHADNSFADSSELRAYDVIDSRVPA